MIKETLGAIKVGAQYNPETEGREPPTSNRVIERMAGLIEQQFMANFESDNDFVNYVENGLSSGVSITVTPWLRQPEGVQRAMIRRLDAIKRFGNQEVHVRVSEILEDIVALTMGPIERQTSRKSSKDNI